MGVDSSCNFHIQQIYGSNRLSHFDLFFTGSVVLRAGLRAGARHPDLRGAQGHRQRGQVHRRGRGHRGRRRLRRGNRLRVRLADHRLRQEPLAQAAGTTRIDNEQSVTHFIFVQLTGKNG